MLPNHLKGWESEGEGKPCWLSGNLEVRSQEARKPIALTWENGRGSSGSRHLAKECRSKCHPPGRPPLFPGMTGSYCFSPTWQTSGRHLLLGIVTGTTGKGFWNIMYLPFQGDRGGMCRICRDSPAQFLLLWDKVALEQKAELRAEMALEHPGPAFPQLLDLVPSFFFFFKFYNISFIHIYFTFEISL